MPKDSQTSTSDKRNKLLATIQGRVLSVASVGAATAKHLKTPQFVKRNKLLTGIFGLIFLFIILSAAGTPNSTPTANTTFGGSGDTSSASNSSSSSNPVNIPTPPPSCTSYQALDSQSWFEIVKDPNSYKDECYTVYGEVTQFDAVTGTSSFLAEVGGVQEAPEYGIVSYPTGAYLTGDPAVLQSVVQQDLFTANVMVLGTIMYKTAMGAQATVPTLQVNSIQVTGSLGN